MNGRSTAAPAAPAHGPVGPALGPPTGRSVGVRVGACIDPPGIPPVGECRLPRDAQLVRAPAAREVAPGVLCTPDPVRLVRLRADHAACRRLVDGQPVPVDHVGHATARRLIDSGAVHLRTRGGAPADAAEVRARTTIVVPIRDRTGELDRTLPTLVAQAQVLVVDDASRDPDAVRRVAHRHGAEIVHRPVNGGPGAARTTGVAHARTELVALVDSDVTGPPGWLAALLPALDDPAVALAAPRIASRPGASLLERFEVAHGPLDLGPRAAVVHPLGRVAYLPSAAWLVRRRVLVAGFTPGMRVAEDVDAVWRLHAAGWRAVHRPEVVVHHAPRADLCAALRQRASYATGAAALAARHPGGAPPLRLAPWTATVLAGLVTLHPVGVAVAAVTTVVTSVRIARTLPVPRPGRVAAGLVTRGLARTLRATSRAAVRAVPAVSLVLVLVAPALASSLAVGWLVDVLADRRARVAEIDGGRRSPRPRGAIAPPLPLVAEVVGRLLDDLAYATGLWVGMWRARSLAALWPRSSGTGHRARTGAA